MPPAVHFFFFSEPVALWASFPMIPLPGARSPGTILRGTVAAAVECTNWGLTTLATLSYYSFSPSSLINFKLWDQVDLIML